MARLAIIVALLVFFSVHSCYDVNGNPFKCPDSLSDKVKEIETALVNLRKIVEGKYNQKCTSLPSAPESYSGCFSKLIDETEFIGECSETDSVVEVFICISKFTNTLLHIFQYPCSHVKYHLVDFFFCCCCCYICGHECNKPK